MSSVLEVTVTYRCVPCQAKCHHPRAFRPARWPSPAAGDSLIPTFLGRILGSDPTVLGTHWPYP